MKTILHAFLLSLLASLNAVAADILVDDSYTPGQRFEQNRQQYPEIRWPVLAFQQGQTVEFEKPYKQVDGRDLHLDIFHPSASKSNGQAILLVHGGGWRSGNKSHFYPLANLLAQRGYLVVTPEYRLSIEAKYPAGLIDINDAAAWVEERSDSLKIQPDKIAVGGGSSGGQMAALLGHSVNVPQFHSDPKKKIRYNAAISLDGVIDFTTPLALQYEDQKKAKSAAALWLGGDYNTIPDIWKQASAISHVSQDSPPTLIISSGQPRFTAGHQALQQALEKLKVDSKYIELDETLHTFWLFEPYVSQTAQWIDSFLQQVSKRGETK